jgi:hypothetical protein
MILLIFICFTFFQLYTGWFLVRIFDRNIPVVLKLIGTILLGTLVSIPITYAFSCIFSNTQEPLKWGMTSFIVVSSLVVGYELMVLKKRIYVSILRKGHIKIDVSSLFLCGAVFSFSVWMMFKTFRGGAGGGLFVGSNNVFDFGHSLGLIRSMSWGGNIPLMSPFFAGAPFFYHFFFQFWIALLEYSGIPLTFAVNIPSVVSFGSLLVIIYYFPSIFLNKWRLAGWIAVLLTVTHSSLTFWYMLQEKGISSKAIIDIWHMQTYRFAGPYDGSVISIYTTLNSYVNQRHLAFASAVGLFLYMLTVKRIENKQILFPVNLIIGFLVGLLFLWNIPICIAVGGFIFFLLGSQKSWKSLVFFCIGSLVIIILSLTQYIPYFLVTSATIHTMIGGAVNPLQQILPHWSIGQYVWENLGILPIFICVGYLVLPKKDKLIALPFILFFLIECLVAGFGKRGFDQKFYSFFIIGVNILAAIGISYIWKKQTVIYKVLALFSIFVLTVSGFVDLMVIKNEFAFPIVDAKTAPVISWIHHNTSKNSLFISYSDMIDPVVLAGRKNYFGFFGNVGWYDRSPIVKQIYGGDIATAKNLGISYILAPKWEKSDFPYKVDALYFEEHHMLVYEDEGYKIFAINELN